MADGHGGSRIPAHPAPVSGPGALSKRTDGNNPGQRFQKLSAAPDQDYGAMKTQLDAQRTAPMAGGAPLPSAPQPDGGDQGVQMPQYQGPAFNAPSQRPDEPVTAGVNIGPGPGSEALNFPTSQVGQGTGQMTALLQQLSASDTTGILGQLAMAAQQRGA